MKILALDVGEKRVGIALSDELCIISTPYGFVDRERAIDKVAEITNVEKVERIVIGLPYLPSGDLGSQSDDILKFSDLLKKTVRCRIDFEDESLSSVEAENRLRQGRKPFEKGDIDAEAAAIILESYLAKKND